MKNINLITEMQGLVSNKIVQAAVNKRERRLKRNISVEVLPRLSTTDYLLQGNNGKRLLESIQQLKEGKLHERV